MVQLTRNLRAGAVAVVALALYASAMVSCGGGPRATLTGDAVTPPPVTDVLRDLRLVHQALSASPDAREVREELEQVASWLDRAELMAAVEDVDHARLALLTEAISGQLVMIKTLYDRRAAERAAAARIEGGDR